MFDIPGALQAGASLIEAAINRIWPDPTEMQRNELARLKTEVDAALAVTQGQFAVIVAEAQGGGFLQRSWRPLTMLVFLGLVVGRFFGLNGENFTADDASNLWNLVELGLGGYVIGRTIEKTVPQVLKTVKEIRR